MEKRDKHIVPENTGKRKWVRGTEKGGGGGRGGVGYKWKSVRNVLHLKTLKFVFRVTGT